MNLTPEELALHLRCVRLCQARQAPRATTETRIALVAFERGISESEMEQFYFVRRKGTKNRHFDYHAFAKKYGVDIHWLWEGDLCAHPRGLTRQQRPASNGRGEALKKNKEAKDTEVNGEGRAQ